MAKRKGRPSRPRMTSYPSITGPHFDVWDQPCIAFAKYDGSNLQFKWTQKDGWCQAGTRKRTIEPDNPLFGSAIQMFQDKYADAILKTSRQHKEYRNAKTLVAFCEFYGEKTFSGLHHERDEKHLKLFDILLPEFGFVLPTQFKDHFGALDIPEIVYEGPLTKQFAQDVFRGKFPVNEGVVAKGVTTSSRRKGKQECDVWMVKIKTRSWLNELQRRAGDTPSLKQELSDNLQQQSANL